MKLEESTKSLTERLNKLERSLNSTRPSVPPPPPAPPLTAERIAEVKSMTLRNNSLLVLFALNGVSAEEIGRLFDAARGRVG